MLTMKDIPASGTRIRWRFNFSELAKRGEWDSGVVRWRDSRRQRVYISDATYGMWVFLEYLEVSTIS